MLHSAVFLDRDGTIARDVHYCRRAEEFELLPGVPDAIRLLNKAGYKVVVITNQSAIARGYLTPQTLSSIHEKMTTELGQHGASIDAIYVCPHHPDEACQCRKPKPTLILRAAAEHGLALDRSYMIGDDPKDVTAGEAAGCRTVLLRDDGSQQDNSPDVHSDHIAKDLFQATQWLLEDARGLPRPRTRNESGSPAP